MSAPSPSPSPSPAAPRVLTVATYNVHRCVGVDGRRDPDRVAEVIRALDCDVVALQEVDCHVHAPGGFDQLEHLVFRLGAPHFVAGPTCRRESVTTGNAILSRHPITAQRWVDLSVGRREPRGALDLDLDVGGTRVRVVDTHLGLRLGERAAQVERLLAALSDDPAPTVLLGDFNEWYPRGHSLRRLSADFEASPPAATFPSWWPALPLDRAFARPRGSLGPAEVFATPAARRASDHLPLRTSLGLELSNGTASRGRTVA